MSEGIRNIVIYGEDGSVSQTIPFAESKPYNLQGETMIVGTPAPAIIHARGDRGVIHPDLTIIKEGKRHFVLRNDATGDEYVAFLDVKSTDSINYHAKRFNDVLGENGFYDPQGKEAGAQEVATKIAFTKKYGIIVANRFKISAPNGIPQILRGQMPKVSIKWQNALDLSKALILPKGISSCMKAGWEYDQILQHMLDTFAGTDELTLSDIVDSSHKFGYKGKLVATGENDTITPEDMVDLTGLVAEWTLELYQTLYRVIRGGGFDNSSSDNTVCYRFCRRPSSYYNDVGVGTTLSW